MRDILVYWQKETADHNLLHTLFSDNHDQSPLISRIANDEEYRYESATVLATMLYLLKGIPFIYQGQEIGIAAAHYDRIEDFDDVESINAYREFCQTMPKEEALAKINFGSRDNARHPMAWDESENGGFTRGIPWIAFHSRHREINVKRDQASNRSAYHFFQALLKLRATHDAFLSGDFHVISNADDHFFVFPVQKKAKVGLSFVILKRSKIFPCLFLVTHQY